MSFRESTSNWQWRYFAAPGIPDILDSIKDFIGSKLTLPDGRVLKSTGFDFPASGSLNMYDIMSNIPSESDRNVIIGEFYAEKHGTLYLGFGADWKWTLRHNGKMLLNALGCRNGEAPIRPTNHTQEINYTAGRNQIVLEVFGGSYRHPGIDGGMDVAMQVIRNVVPLKMVYPPFVCFPDGSENAVSIIFSASRKSPAAVEYRLPGTETWQRVYDNLGGQMRRDRAVHSIRLEDLQPGTIYEYRAVLLDDCNALAEIEDGLHTFKTAAAPGEEFIFTASADLQDPESRTEYIENLLGKNAPADNAFFAFIGDLFWTSDFNRSVMDEFVLPFSRIAGDKMPLVMVRGNHEIYGKDSNRYFEYFTPPFPYREGYYMFKWGDVCFIVLDFCDDEPNVPPPSTRQFHDFEPYLAAEAKWLKKAVNAPICRDAKYRIVLAHGIPLGDVHEYMPGNVRKVIDPVFGGKNPQVQIHLWLGGHVHRPFRSVPLSNEYYSMVPPEVFDKEKKHPPIGINYSFPVVITGGPTGALGQDMQFTAIQVKVDSDKLSVSSLDRNNALFDCFTITANMQISEVTRSEKFKRYSF